MRRQGWFKVVPGEGWRCVHCGMVLIQVYVSWDGDAESSPTEPSVMLLPHRNRTLSPHGRPLKVRLPGLELNVGRGGEDGEDGRAYHFYLSNIIQTFFHLVMFL